MKNTSSKKILIVEDEPKLAKVLEDYLQQSGYQTHWLEDGLEVIPWIKAAQPDLVLLDLMLPGRDGMDICRELRSFSHVPVIMVTARVEEIDRLLGLELGADDYVCKPYSPREVVARVKAILRRIDPQRPGAFRQSEFVVDTDRHEVRLRGQPLDLTPVEFRLLSALLAHPGRVYSRAQLLDHLYDDHRIVTDRTVDSHIKNLRRKLEGLLPGREVIRSIYGIGYKIEV